MILPEDQRRLLVIGELMPFIAHISGKNVNSISLQSDIVNDLRLTGDDVQKILSFLNRRFGVNFSKLNFHATFGNEGAGIQSFFQMLRWLVWSKPVQSSATVSQLIDAAVAGEWQL